MNEETSFPPLSPLQIIAIVQELSIFPALPVMVFMRQKIGFRRVKLSHVFLMAGLIYISAMFLNDNLLRAFAYAVAIVGYVHSRKRWIGLKRGEKWHTLSNGVSQLEYFRFPEWCFQEERIYRYIEPVVIAVFAYLIFHFIDFGLGLWLLLGAFAVTVRQHYEYEWRLNQFLDRHDAQIDLLSIREVSRHPKVNTPLKEPESYGIPTGIGEDIMDQVEKRQREMEAAQLNMASPGSNAASYALPLGSDVIAPPPPPVEAVVSVMPDPPAATQEAPAPAVPHSAPDNLAD